jgi:hypothetical protein
MSSFFDTYFAKKKKPEPTNLLENLFKIPKKDKGVNRGRLGNVSNAGAVHQADLLSLPEDKQYRYCLVVVDVYSRVTDAEPLKEKSAETVLSAFKKIYNRKILNLPTTQIEVDAGSEFKSVVHDWFISKGIRVRVAMAGRHRQQGLVETRNKIIGSALHKRMAGQELLTGQTSKEWVDDLPHLIRAMNKRTNETQPKVQAKIDKIPLTPQVQGDAKNIIPEGTKVRVALDNPIDVATGKRLHGSFRSSDIRWSDKVRTVKEVLLKPQAPVTYLLDGHIGKRKLEYIAYTKNQLSVIHENEQYPLNAIRKANKNTTYVVEKILDQKTENGRVYLKVKWVGYPVSEASWEPLATLKKQVPEMVKQFMDKK